MAEQAQEPRAPQFGQNICNSLAAQRNAALDAAAVAEARATTAMQENAQLRIENAALRARIEEMAKLITPPPAPRKRK
jgi:regulator of replication initiation timing